uniref:Uncharacterized protein n=1 Tax=viral metagenome TaxID=1070528 RepID=A0A6C0B8J0_9ZZZZ
MNTFQNYVFVTTLFCLLVALTITAIVLKKSKTGSYPPVADNCPDYWYNSYYDLDSATKSVGGCKSAKYGCCLDGVTSKSDTNGSNCSTCSTSQYGCCPDNKTPKTDDVGSTCPPSKCYNTKNLGTVSDTCSTEMDFSNYSTCQKQTWAKDCNITWDGITNVTNAC